MTPDNARAGFNRAGLVPWNPEKVLASCAMKLGEGQQNKRPKTREDKIGNKTFSTFIEERRRANESKEEGEEEKKLKKYDVLHYKHGASNLVTEEEALEAYEANQREKAERKAEAKGTTRKAKRPRPGSQRARNCPKSRKRKRPFCR